MIKRLKRWSWYCTNCNSSFRNKRRAENCYKSHFPKCPICKTPTKEQDVYNLNIDTTRYEYDGFGASIGLNNTFYRICIKCKDKIMAEIQPIIKKYQQLEKL